MRTKKLKTEDTPTSEIQAIDTTPTNEIKTGDTVITITISKNPDSTATSQEEGTGKKRTIRITLYQE
ncbi:hypothetical protein EZS27_013552 [termite gut metagenome]|uniref:Uncharacterized protein n=1 Tax=termite gut metagenome TaxID=433724 RepID=A0A5J4RXA0_9ZZZZ